MKGKIIYHLCIQDSRKCDYDNKEIANRLSWISQGPGRLVYIKEINKFSE